ncbi:putative G-protein coupled receptor 33 [Discoglossus pictus]
MSLDSSSDLHINITDGTTPTRIPVSQLVSAILLLLTFLFGLVGNSLYIWVLGFRMRKSVNITYFFHLILTNLVFTFTIPFASLYILWQPHWIFGVFLCKAVNSLITLSMYASVFLLTVISIDRYMLVFHPHLYRRRMNLRYASVICLCLWGLAVLCSSPYLLFRQIRQDNKTTICYNDYTLSGKWNDKQKINVKWSMFCFRLLLGFLLPFCLITYFYLKIIYKIKTDHLVSSNKPYKIIFTTITSFFVSYISYHLWYGMRLMEDRYLESIQNALEVTAICLSCFNSCFTPTFYLFVVENVKNVFKTSILSLIEAVFTENSDAREQKLEEKSEIQLTSVVKDQKQGESIENVNAV